MGRSRRSGALHHRCSPTKLRHALSDKHAGVSAAQDKALIVFRLRHKISSSGTFHIIPITRTLF